MSEKSHSQFQIVSAIDEAIKNGTNRVAIPIQRENELVGTEGVTKFYDSLNQSILPDIKKKLEKQGLRLKLGKEDYKSTSIDTSKINYGDGKYYEAEADFLNRLEVPNPNREALLRELDDPALKPELKFSNVFRVKAREALNSTKSNPLHVIEIEHIPGTKVNWDMYSVLGGIGLTGLADKLKEQENVQSE
jgi:hypothetical protein